VNDTTSISRLESKLDILIKLFALSVISQEESVGDRAIKLQRAGLTPKEIAVLCDTTPNTVSVALSNAKRGGKLGRKRGR
jgi:hypothetical protein